MHQPAPPSRVVDLNKESEQALAQMEAVTARHEAIAKARQEYVEKGAHVDDKGWLISKEGQVIDRGHGKWEPGFDPDKKT